MNPMIEAIVKKANHARLSSNDGAYWRYIHDLYRDKSDDTIVRLLIEGRQFVLFPRKLLKFEYAEDDVCKESYTVGDCIEWHTPGTFRKIVADSIQEVFKIKFNIQLL